jgi:hypothetical protein
MLCYTFIQYIWCDFDITGFKIKSAVHIISGSALSSLKNLWWAPVIQPIHNLWYYHSHINHWPDQQASLTQHCQAVHYDHCPRLLIFHAHLSADRVPNAAAQNALRCIIQWLLNMGRITSNYQLTTHRNVGATACPGNSLFNLVRTWPRFTTSPRCWRGTASLYAEGSEGRTIEWRQRVEG